MLKKDYNKNSSFKFWKRNPKTGAKIMEKTKRTFEDIILISIFVGFFVFCTRYVFTSNNLGGRIIIIAMAAYSASLATVLLSCFAGWIKRYQIHLLDYKITLFVFLPVLAIAILIECFS